MSAKYFECYFDTNETLSHAKLLAFNQIVENKDWNKLIERYGDNAKLLIGFSKESTVDVYEKLDHYLDISFDFETKDNAICLRFDTFTSFDEYSFLSFLMHLGFKRIESSIENSSLGSVQYFLNDREIDANSSTNWNWIEVKNEANSELENNTFDEWSETIEIPLNDINKRPSEFVAKSSKCPENLIQLTNLSIKAASFKLINNIDGYLVLTTIEEGNYKIRAYSASTSEAALSAVNRYLDKNKISVSAYSIVNFSAWADHPEKIDPARLIIETGEEGSLCSYCWLMTFNENALQSLEYYLTSTNRITSALESKKIDTVVLAPTVRRLVVRAGLMSLGLFLIPYVWLKVLCFIAVLYLSISFKIRRKLILSKNGFQMKDAMFNKLRIRDIECVREVEIESVGVKVILMVSEKNKAMGSRIRNTSDLNDEEFTSKIKEFCNNCSIAYQPLEGSHNSESRQ